MANNKNKMKTIVFFSFPVAGHVNPQHDLCEELSKKNIRLIYFTAKKYQSLYANNDRIILKTYPKDFMVYWDKLQKDPILTSKFMPLNYAFNCFNDFILPFVIDEVGKIKPDLIISDTLAVWGKACARYYKIPYAIFFSCFIGDSLFLKKNPAVFFAIMKSGIVDGRYVQKFMKLKKKIEGQYGKITDPISQIMSHQNKFSIVATSQKFHPGGDEYGKNIHFMRPSIYKEDPIDQKKDTIFISVGTIVYSKDFWDICLEATKEFNYRVVISFGNNRMNSIESDKLRDNVELYDNLPLDQFRKELERTEIFITHGGFNSITDGIIAETKFLVCPVTIENVNNGKVIEKYGCGTVLDKKHITTKKLRDAIEKLINMNCKKNIRSFKESFVNENSCETVIQELDREFSLNLYENAEQSK